MVLDDGVNVFKTMCKDGRFVAGAAGAEIELARRLQIFADSTPGLEQYLSLYFPLQKATPPPSPSPYMMIKYYMMTSLKIIADKPIR